MARKLALVFALVTTLCVVARAKEVTIERRDHGLVDVVKRNCNSILWTSEVMRQTPIDSSQLTSLNVGDIVVIPDECATQKPSTEIRRATLRVFKHQQVFLQRKNAQDAVSALNESQTKLDAMTKEISALTTQNQSLVKELMKARTPTPPAVTTNKYNHVNMWFAVVVSSEVVLLITLVILGFSCRHMAKENRVLRARPLTLEEDLRTCQADLGLLQRKVTIRALHEAQVLSTTYHGKVVQFTDTSERFVGCPICTEKKIGANKQNMIAHLNKTHPSLRLEQISPEEMRRKMEEAETLYLPHL